MSNIDKQALRQTAEKAQEHGVFNMDIHSETVLALLDELEPIALAHLNLNLLCDVYRSAYEEARHDGLVNWEAAASLAEENSDLKRKLEAAEKRVAELEALARGVKQFSEFQICHYGATEDYAKGYIDCQNNYNKVLFAAAGKGEWMWRNPGEDLTPLYTAPPAPVFPRDLEEIIFTIVNAMADEKLRNDENELFSLAKKYIEHAKSKLSAAMLQGSQPVSNRDELPLDYLQGHKDGLEWAAQLAEANHPQTGDWLYDDPIELAKAIRKGPDMPEADGNSPVVADGWVMVPVEPTAEMLQSGISAHYERSQIQIHDRPAPGPMECAYVAMLAAAPQQEVK